MAKGPHDPRALRAHFERACAFDVELAFRPMFGGIMAYAQGRPFALMSSHGIALKLGAERLADLLTLPGARPLRFDPNRAAIKSYALVPDALIEDASALRLWAERAALYAKAQPLKPPQARKRR